MEDGHREGFRIDCSANPVDRFEQTGNNRHFSIIAGTANSFENPDAVRPSSMSPQLALDAVLEESDSWLAKIDPTLSLLGKALHVG